MKKNGFTLVELIITIVIMGVILAVAFPSIGRLQQNNKYKKYVSYGESMVASAKLYVDQYHEDIWGSTTAVGTKKITMEALKNSTLMKEYTDAKDTCTNGEVSVTRTGSKNNFIYTYTYSLVCFNKGKNVTCNGDEKTSICTLDGREVYNSAG